MRSAVQRRSVVVLHPDRLQPGQQRHREERKPLPHHREDHAGHRRARLRQPRHRVRQQPEQEVVQRINQFLLADVAETTLLDVFARDDAEVLEDQLQQILFRQEP
jgi:hypothetical protein